MFPLETVRISFFHRVSKSREVHLCWNLLFAGKREGSSHTLHSTVFRSSPNILQSFITLEPITMYSSNEKRKENKKHLSSNMRYRNTEIGETSRTPALPSPQGALLKRVRSSAATHISHFNGSTAPCTNGGSEATHTRHQFGYRLLWNYRNERIKWTETYHRELRPHLGSWPRPLYHDYPSRANPSDALQERLGHSGQSLLARDRPLQRSPLRSSLRSLPTSLW